MDAIQRVIEGIRTGWQRLDSAGLEPDPGRTDWGRERARLDQLSSGLRDEVLASLGEALAALETPEEKEELARTAGFLAAEVAGLLHAAGRDDARPLLSRAILETGFEGELSAAEQELDLFAMLVRGRWLARHGQDDAADRWFAAVRKRAKAEPLRKAALDALERPRGIAGAPLLARLNGFGFGLYGQWDHRPDGSYLAYWCLSALWIPLLPLRTYRVRAESNGTTTFFSRRRLGPRARLWQLGVGIATAAAIALGGNLAWQTSPWRLAPLQLEATQAMEAGGDLEGAAVAYDRLLVRWAKLGPARVHAEAGRGSVRVALARLGDPLDGVPVDEARRLVSRIASLPPPGRSTAAAEAQPALERWAEAAEAGRPDDALVLWELARTNGAGDRAGIDERRTALTLKLAAARVGEDPSEALALWARHLDRREVLELATGLLESLADEPSLLLDSQAEVAIWLGRAKRTPELAGTVKKVEASLELARGWSTDPARRALLEAGEQGPLEAALAATPADQGLRVAVAAARRDAGAASEAESVLLGRGGAGRLGFDGQLLAAALREDADDLDRARAILSRLVTRRLPRYLDAHARWAAREKAANRELYLRWDRGQLPPELARQLRAAGDAKAEELFSVWVEQQLDKDGKLLAIGEELERVAPVVSASLRLGAIELRLASVRPQEREARLAASERAFLGVSRAAEGSAGLHLGLGEVYHRLGKEAEGDAELQRVLDRKEPNLTLAVVATYRELGKVPRARAIAEKLFAQGNVEVKREAAEFLSVLSYDLEERENWLRRIPEPGTWVKVRLDDVAARRLLDEGRCAEAEPLLVRAAAAWGSVANTDSGGSHNQALLLQRLYSCTGDAKQLADARAGLERALRLDESSLTVGALADARVREAQLDVLGKSFPVHGLRLDEEDASALLGELIGGPSGTDTRRMLSGSRALRQARDLYRRQQLLSPANPEGWFGELKVLRWTGAGAEAEKLEQRMRSAPKLVHDGAGQKEQEAQPAPDPGAEERRKAYLATALARNEELLARNKHPRARAAALSLRGGLRRSVARLERAPDRSREAARDFQEAVRLWPALGDDEVARSLVQAALLETARSTPALQRRLEAHPDVPDELNLLAVLEAEGGGEVARALRSSPDLLGAAAVRRRDPRAAAFLDTILGRLVGDAALEQAGTERLADPDLRRQEELAATLFPSESMTLRLKLMRSVPATP